MTAASGYVDFKVKVEPWNEYVLNDGSRLRARFILLKLRASGAEGSWQYEPSMQVHVVVQGAPELRGPAAPVPLPDQIEENLRLHGVVVEAVGGLNEQECLYDIGEHGTLRVLYRLKAILRTTLRGPDGDPIYKVDSSIELKLDPPSKNPGARSAAKGQ